MALRSIWHSTSVKMCIRDRLYTILDTIRELFPECERVTSYASPASIRIRTEEELRTLRDKGLTMVLSLIHISPVLKPSGHRGDDLRY